MNKKVIAILGPTGIGKTDLALILSKLYDLNIISADAFQIYKELNIGVNKPVINELNLQKYFGINLISINEKYSIFDFQTYARNIINSSTLPVIIVGGSMLYLDSVIYDYTLPSNFDNSNKYENYNNEELYELLKTKDLLSANKLHKNNRNRVMTALNYYLQFHESITLNKNRNKLVYETLFIYLKPLNKQILNEQNALRIKKMLNKGWIKEVKDLLDIYPDLWNYNAIKAIGYKTILNSILNNEKLDIQRIIYDTNHYVKHQLSWYKRYENNCLILNNYKEWTKYQKVIENFIKND